MEYPVRPKFFAQQFIRLLTKSAAAQDLGPSVCWMLTIIACQEDAKRYIEPARWYYEQLMPLCGFNSRKQLRAAIEKATSLGWLVYEPGRKGTASRFFVIIPTRYQELDGGACDESDTLFGSDSELQREQNTESGSD